MDRIGESIIDDAVLGNLVMEQMGLAWLHKYRNVFGGLHQSGVFRAECDKEPDENAGSYSPHQPNICVF